MVSRHRQTEDLNQNEEHHDDTHQEGDNVSRWSSNHPPEEEHGDDVDYKDVSHSSISNDDVEVSSLSLSLSSQSSHEAMAEEEVVVNNTNNAVMEGSSSNIDEEEQGSRQRRWLLLQHRSNEAFKQLLCGGIAGSVAKTITAPFSRLTILFQVHSLVTTKEHRPKFAMSIYSGMNKIIERGGLFSLWRGNMTSVLHRFPYSAINFYIYENTLDILSSGYRNDENNNSTNNNDNHNSVTRRRNNDDDNNHDDDDDDDDDEEENQLVRRMSKIWTQTMGTGTSKNQTQQNNNNNNSVVVIGQRRTRDSTPARHKFMAGALAGTVACVACYPLDLVRTRLTTELEGHERYRGIADAFRKIHSTEGVRGFYSGIIPTLFVAVPNFAISYTVYGTLKEYLLDDELFYNLRRINAESGETRLGFTLTVMCGASSGILATMLTFPMDTIRRRMQIQNLHLSIQQRLTPAQHLHSLINKEGLGSLYRGLTPELIKVIPMVGTMFVVYEWTKEMLNVRQDRR